MSPSPAHFSSNVRHVHPSSILFASLVGLVLLFLVPNRARTKQVLLEARQDDRFSPQLRVVARASKNNVPKQRKDTTPTRAEMRSEGASSGYVLTQTSPPETMMMRRPNVIADRMAAQFAAERERRRVQLAQRSAAARRRLILTAVLLLATLSGGIAVAVASMSAFFIAVPAVLLTTVLILGRRAVVLNARADARYLRLQQARAEDLAAAGEDDAVTEETPSEIVETEVAQAPSEEEVAAAEPVESATWTPTPVPAPAYTLKAPAPRWEPAPLDLPEQNYLAASARAIPSPEVAENVAEPAENMQESVVEGEESASAELELDLDAILERRRAAGA